MGLIPRLPKGPQQPVLAQLTYRVIQLGKHYQCPYKQPETLPRQQSQGLNSHFLAQDSILFFLKKDHPTGFVTPSGYRSKILFYKFTGVGDHFIFSRQEIHVSLKE